jgi:hypothetical protein
VGNLIITIIVFGAFFRAAREYSKNGVAWGLIGVAAYFIPQYVVLFAVGAIVYATSDPTSSGSEFTIPLLAGFAAGVLCVIWTYNKLMERAIDEQAALAAKASAVPTTPVS